MTTPTGSDPDDSFWRRPSGPPGSGTGPADRPVGPGPSGTASGYSGPPVGGPPPPQWRPPVHVQPPPPRELPPQDSTGIDQAERNARTTTYGVGLIAGAIMLVLVCLLCSRALF